MALYHFHVEQIGRSKGYSAVAATAYRSGEKLYCDYYGETHDYTKKGGILYTEIMMPEYCPERFKDRAALWNEVEKVEKHPKAQLCYSFDMALQNELTYEENLELARRFVLEEMVARGMICDIAIHAPGKTKDDIPNPHIHVLAAIRPYLKEGRWGEKQHREYALDENGERIRDEKGRYVFNAIPTTDWGRPETLDHWRERWAEMINARFEEKGLSCRVDHRSYKDQGLDLIPQVHEGSAVRRMEARGIVTEKGEFNRFVSATNRMIKEIVRKLKDLAEWFRNIKPELNRLEEPTLSRLLMEYFDYRNEVAVTTYTRGVQKAKESNFKLLTKVYAYLEENGIRTLADLEQRINDLNHSAEFAQRNINSLSSSVKQYSDEIRYAGYLRDTRSIYEQSQKIFFPGAKKKFQKEHDAELKKYHAAASYFAGKNLTAEPEEFIGGWEKSLKEDSEKLTAARDDLKVYQKDLKQLKEIRRAIDFALAKRNGEDVPLPPLKIYDTDPAMKQMQAAKVSFSGELSRAKAKQKEHEEARHAENIQQDEQLKTKNKWRGVDR